MSATTTTTNLDYVRECVRCGKPISARRAADLLRRIDAAEQLSRCARAVLGGPDATNEAALSAAVDGYAAARKEGAQ